jgi:hypothetical protein
MNMTTAKSFVMTKTKYLLTQKRGYWGKTFLALPEKLAQQTGLKNIVGLVFERDGKTQCSIPGCYETALALHCRIIGVTEKDGEFIDINHLSPDIADQIRQVRTAVSLCAWHCLDRLAEEQSDPESTLPEESSPVRDKV